MRLFSILLGLGTTAGLILASWRAPHKEVARYLDAGAGILFGALLGSRAVMVAVNWGYYQSHPLEIFAVWQGGLSSIGALLGGALAVILLAIWLHLPLGLLADVYLPLAGMLTMSAWLGCWVNGCSYGAQSQAWWALPSRDEWGVVSPRMQVQLMAAFLTLLYFLWLERLHKKLPQPGLGALLGLLGISAGIFFFSFLRADPAPVISGLRLEAWGALGLIIPSGISAVVLLLRWKLGHKRSAPGSQPTTGR